MLQTGWNLETALALDLNDYEHAISKSVDSDVAMLVSSKRRGGNIKKPYVTEKTIIAPSDISDQYSAYNLYKLLFRVTLPLRKGKAYKEIVDELGYEPAFIFLMHHYTKRSRIINTFSKMNRNIAVSSKVINFLEKNPIYENNKRILEKNHFLQRLRPTWQRLKKRSGYSRASITMLLGHSDFETKDIYYDNSAPATLERKKRGGEELKAVESSIRDHSFKGKAFSNTK